MSEQEAADTIAQRLQPEWEPEYNAYLEAHQMGFEQYESSIHQDGFAAGWTLGIESAALESAARLAAAEAEVGRLREIVAALSATDDRAALATENVALREIRGALSRYVSVDDCFCLQCDALPERLICCSECHFCHGRAALAEHDALKKALAAQPATAGEGEPTMGPTCNSLHPGLEDRYAGLTCIRKHGHRGAHAGDGEQWINP
jgi:hypothetical protein